MNPASAVSFILLSSGIYLHAKSPRAAKSLAGAVLLIGLIRALDYFQVTHIGIDSILFREKMYGNFMSPNTALNLILIGAAFLSADARGRFTKMFGDFAANTAVLISLIAVIGYGYGFSALYKVKLYMPMPVNSALACLLGGVGVMCLLKDRGILSLLMSKGPGSAMTRRIFPATVLVPTLFGGLRILGERHGLYGSEFGLMMMVVFTIVIFNWLTYGMAKQIDAADAAIRKAEEALKQANDGLEKTVQERTAELKGAQNALVQQERLGALGQMASGIAHDFNNALSPILGYSELMLDDPKVLDNKEEVLQNLRTINTATKDAANVVRRLREFARPHGDREIFSAVDLSDLAKQMYTLTTPKWKTQAQAAGLSVAFKIDAASVPKISGNESQLRELLTNLIFNAVDAMPSGGTLSLSTKSEQGRVVLRVGDTGTGMPEEVRRRCLEPFFSTKGEKGTGLGLSMVYGIVQQHEGTMEIQSEVGKGTTFVMSFPEMKQDTTAAPEVAKVRKIKKLRILYAEDEQPVREIFSRYLLKDGHEVDAVSNGIDALAKFEPEKYDLVITDHAMPGMTGEQFAAVLKKKAPGKPVILISGTADSVPAESGIDMLLRKPVTLDEIRKALATFFS